MLSAQQRQLFASPPPVPSKAVMARNNHASEHRDVDSAALCAAEGRPLRARAVRVVEMMLYSYESDILVMKLMEYGDLLHQLRANRLQPPQPPPRPGSDQAPAPADRVDAGAGPRGS